jgi:hypothetical protein
VVKIKVALEQAMKAQRGIRSIATLPLTLTLDWVGVQRDASRDFTPRKTRYPLYRSLGGPQGPL